MPALSRFSFVALLSIFGHGVSQTPTAPTPAQLDWLAKVAIAAPETVASVIETVPQSERRRLLETAWRGLDTYDMRQARAWLPAGRGLVRLARIEGDRKAIAFALYAGGGLALAAQDWSEAEIAYAEAAKIFVEIGDGRQEGRTRINRMIALTAASRFEDGIAEGKLALEIVRRVKDWENESILGTQISDAYLRLGRVAEARQAAQSGLEVAKAHHDSDLASMAGLNLANVLYRAGELKEALPLFTASGLYFKEKKDLINYAACEEGRFVVLLGTKRFTEAEAALRTAHEIYVEAADPVGLSRTTLNHAGFLLSTGRYAQAAEASLEAEQLAKEVDKNSAIMAVGNYGSALQEQGLYAEAFEAMHRFELLAHEQSANREVALAKAGIGSALAGLGKRKEAIKSYREAVKLLEDSGNLNEVAAFRTNLDVLLAIEHDADAPAYLNGINLAIRELAKNPKVALEHATRFLSTAEVKGNPSLQSVGHFTQGRALLRLGRKEEALKALEQALAGFAEQRSLASDPLFAVYAMKNAEGILGELFEAGAQTASPERLFQSIQKANGATVRRSLLSANLLTQGLTSEESDGLLALFQSYQESKREADRGRLLAYEARLRVLHPRWAGIEAAPVNSQSIANVLGPNALGIEFVVSDRSVFAVCLSLKNGQAKTELVRLPVSPRSLQVDADAFRAKILAGADRTDPKFLALGRRLYDGLLEPILRHRATGTKLVVSAWGPLSGLPFVAALDQKRRYLIETMPLVEAPSLSAWQACHDRAVELGDKAVRDPLLVAISRFGGSAPSGASVRRGTDQARLPDLDSVSQEKTAFHGWAPNAVDLFEKEATRNRVIERLPKAGAIHFATHAISNDRSPLLGALVLAPGKDGKPTFLTAGELTFMALNSRFAFLSACSTSSGAASRDGALGLSWAFTVSGVPTVIASRWNVDDSAVGSWAKSFYEAQKKGLSIAASAQRASKESIGKTGSVSKPIAWAAWGVFGNG